MLDFAFLNRLEVFKQFFGFPATMCQALFCPQNVVAANRRFKRQLIRFQARKYAVAPGFVHHFAQFWVFAFPYADVGRMHVQFGAQFIFVPASLKA